MLTAWHMSVRMDPELDPHTMVALADALLSLHDGETDYAVHFVGLRLDEGALTDMGSLRAAFTPKAVGFAPIAADALHRLMRETESAETLEIRLFNLDAGRVTIRLEGLELSVATEIPQTLLLLTRALVQSDLDEEEIWKDPPCIKGGADSTLSQDDLPIRHAVSGS